MLCEAPPPPSREQGFPPRAADGDMTLERTHDAQMYRVMYSRRSEALSYFLSVTSCQSLPVTSHLKLVGCSTTKAPNLSIRSHVPTLKLSTPEGNAAAAV